MTAPRASSWELIYNPGDIYCYTYAGGVLFGYFSTNWVPLVPNVVTNFRAQYQSAIATNELFILLSSNCISANETFYLGAGGRGGGLPRSGFRTEGISLQVAQSQGDVPGAVMPWEAHLQSSISFDYERFHIHALMEVCENNGEVNNCSKLTLTNNHELRASDSSALVRLRLGDPYRLRFSLDVGSGEISGEACELIGTVFMYLKESCVLEMSLTSTVANIALTGHPKRTYVIERTTNLVDWQPLVTNTPPDGIFAFEDLSAPSNSSVFYRGRKLE